MSYPLALGVRVFSLATPLQDASESTAQMRKGYESIFDVVRIYAGQPDPIDMSHFTFTVVTHDKTLHFDGWLLDNDTVKLEPREGYPAAETLPATTQSVPPRGPG